MSLDCILEPFLILLIRSELWGSLTLAGSSLRAEEDGLQVSHLMYCGPLCADVLDLLAPDVVKAQLQSPLLLSIDFVLFELWQESRSGKEG